MDGCFNKFGGGEHKGSWNQHPPTHPLFSFLAVALAMPPEAEMLTCEYYNQNYNVNSALKFTCPRKERTPSPTAFSNVLLQIKCLRDSLDFNNSRSKGQASSKLHPLRSSWPKRVPQRRCLVWCNCWRARWTCTSDKWWKLMPWRGKPCLISTPGGCSCFVCCRQMLEVRKVQTNIGTTRSALIIGVIIIF